MRALLKGSRPNSGGSGCNDSKNADGTIRQYGTYLTQADASAADLYQVLVRQVFRQRRC